MLAEKQGQRAGLEISIKPDNRVVPLPEGNSYLGFIFARGDRPEQVEAALREAHRKLQLTIVPEIHLAMNRRE